MKAREVKPEPKEHTERVKGQLNLPKLEAEPELVDVRQNAADKISKISSDSKKHK